MFTADDARQHSRNDLDLRIEAAVKDRESGRNAAHLRVYDEDWFFPTIRQELENRGFINIEVPDIILKGDVYFEW